MAKYLKIDADISNRIIDLIKSSGNFLSEKEYDRFTDEVFTDNESEFDSNKSINSIIIKLLCGSLD